MQLVEKIKKHVAKIEQLIDAGQNKEAIMLLHDMDEASHGLREWIYQRDPTVFNIPTPNGEKITFADPSKHGVISGAGGLSIHAGSLLPQTEAGQTQEQPSTICDEQKISVAPR